MTTNKMTTTKIINFSLLALSVVILLLVHNYQINLAKHSGTLNAIEGYINFSSISLGFLGTIISMLTVLSKQSFLKAVLAKTEAKKDFKSLGIISIISGFSSIIIAIVSSYLIGNGCLGIISQYVLASWVISSTFYIVNFSLYLIINLASIFSEIEENQ